ncbi:hypothetical protein TPY_2654 [Sulfobacillus acidophilus TPY]|nr:hypothetical protein TPY_2654 [Sulfobacillus acidophilus TPY]
MPRWGSLVSSWEVKLITRAIRGGIAGGLLLLIFGILQNAGAAIAFGIIGWMAPALIAEIMGETRWARLDRSSFAAMTNAHFFLERGTPVVETFRRVFESAQPSFRRWFRPMLLGEAAGQPLESTLHQQAEALQHQELMVAADILAAERQYGQTAATFHRLLTLWNDRIELDGERRGTLSTFVLMGHLFILIGITGFFYFVVANPVVRSHAHTGAGGMVIAISAWLLAGAVAWHTRFLRAMHQR